MEEQKFCPVSGLPIIQKPEWIDVPLADGYAASFCFIGQHILLSIPKGYATGVAMQNYFAKRKQIIDQQLAEDEPFFELKDYSHITHNPSKEARDEYARHMLAHKHRIIGFIGYCAPTSIRLSINVGRSIFKSPFPMQVVDSYRAAVLEALDAVRSHSFSDRCSRIISSQDWEIELGDFKIRYEILPGGVLHSIPQGYLNESYLEPIIRLHQKLLCDMNLDGKPLSVLVNLEHMPDTSRRARLGYLDYLRELSSHQPLNHYVVYGPNRKLRATISLLNPMLPFHVKIARNLEEGISLIHSYAAGPIKETITLQRDTLNDYIEELLNYIGNINWEIEGYNPPAIEEQHPFSPIFDAIALIKSDLDDLLAEQKQIQEDLRQSQQRFKVTFEHAPIGITQTSSKGRILTANPEFCRMLGYSAEELQQMSYKEITHPNDIQSSIEQIQQLERGQFESFVMEKRYLHKDGHIVWGRIHVAAVRDEQARSRYNVAIVEDITHQREMASFIREQEQKYRTILENIHAGYYEVDLHGSFTFVNETMNQILGINDLRGLNYKDFMELENSGRLFKIFNEAYTKGLKQQRFEWELIRRDGPTISVEATVSLILDPGGNPIGFRGIVQDISARKLSQILEREKFKAEASSQAKSDFLANISHEIRTPLNGIIGMTELSLDTELDSYQRDLITTISSEAEALMGLINQVLDFSKIEAGKMELEEIPFNLRHIIEDIANICGIMATKKNLEFTAFIEPDVPVYLIGDPNRLRQILTNLTGNALKFTNKGQINLQVSLRELENEQALLLFTVQDTGIGIEKEKQAGIFESFTQADSSTTRKYGGTGLGTTISQHLVHMLGGEIGLESEKGKGSTFWFTARFERRTAPEKEAVSLEGTRALVVDDNPTNLQILCEHLKSWNCLPVEAGSAEAGLSVLKAGVALRESFDIIISDFFMPEMNGFDFAARIREIESLKNIPIIILTSSGSVGKGISCRDPGVQACLIKPIRRNDLYETITTVLDLQHEKRKKMPATPSQTASRDQFRLLLAEDYPTNQQVALRHLRSAGYKVDLAENGLQATMAQQKQRYDLILMDLQMPVMDGFEATQAIREWERQYDYPPVTIIAMTAHAVKGYREACLNKGMDDYITKPLRRKELIKTIDSWLLKRQAQPPAEDKIPNSALPMDLELALDEFENDRELLMEVIEGFLQTTAAQLEKIRSAIAAGDAETVRKEAHAIKGGAANLCAEELSGIAKELEECGAENRLEPAVLERLADEHERLRDYYQSIKED